MARPKKSERDKRTERLPALRMTPQELAATKQTANDAGLPLTTFARDMVLNGRIVLGGEIAIDPALVLELKRIGVNLNQIARVANSTGDIPPGLSAVCERVNQVMDRLVDKLV